MSAPIRLRKDVTLGDLASNCVGYMLRWMHDPEVADNLGLRNEPTLERTREWISNALQDKNVRVYTIHLEGRYVGNVVFDRVDAYLGTARLSVYIGDRSARGAGVGFSGMAKAIRRAFDELDLHKIWLTVHVDNQRARRVYERLGFVSEGTLRSEFILRGQRTDVDYMGLLRDEFDRLPVASD